VVRLPQNTNDDIEEDPTGTKSLWDRGLLSGASQKAECVAVCHLGMVFSTFLIGSKINKGVGNHQILLLLQIAEPEG
jgi:hypothetical protein